MHISNVNYKNINMTLEESKASSNGCCIRLSVLGAKAVGKTAIIVRYLTRRFIGEYRSQIDISYQHTVTICHQRTQIVITDFSPKHGEDLVPDVETSHCDCFLVVFSIVDRMSFLKAVNIVSVLRSFPSSESTPITLLGNKKDLDHCRQVSLEELQNLSTLLKCQYAEVSVAESREDIVPIIFTLFQRVLEDPYINKNVQKQNQKAQMNNNSDFCLEERSLTKGGCKECGESSCMKKECSKENRSSLSNTSSTGSDTSKDESRSKRYCTYFTHGDQPIENYLCKQMENDLIVTNRKGGRNCSPLTRSQSLQTKERKFKSEKRLTKNRKLRTNLSFSLKTTPSSRQQMESPDLKKDSRTNNFLNWSKSSEDPETLPIPTISTKTSNSKNEPGSLASIFLRGKYITQDENSMETLKPQLTISNGSKPLSKSINSLASKFLVSESPSKKAALELPKALLKAHSSSISDSKNPYRSKDHTDSRLEEFLTTRSISMLGSPSHRPNKGPEVSHPPIKGEFTSPQTPGKRERKFGVFGRGVLGNVFSKTSLPDIPKATANLYTKFDSIKKTIKKRSV